MTRTSCGRRAIRCRGRWASPAAWATDRFCLLGEVDQQIERLRELEELGVRQVNLYVMTSRVEETVERYGRDIIPQFEPVAVA